MRRVVRAIPVLLPLLTACPASDDAGDDETSLVGSFDGLFDDVATGFNFPFDIGIAPDDPVTTDAVEGGDIFVANYGTSEILRVSNPSDMTSVAAEPFFDGASEGLAGAMAVSVPAHTHVWAAFEQGGVDDAGGVVVLDEAGTALAVFDASVDPDAFANPGGICFGGWSEDALTAHFFITNLGDGTAWRMDVGALDGTDPVFTRVGSGLATGTLGNPGSPGNELSSSTDLPEGGARGCVYAGGSLYVADAQNARVVRFDDADLNGDIEALLLEETPPDLVTYPTDLTINSDGYLIVISYDNAHAFVTLELPDGGFIDDGLQDLNVNAGNYGTAVAFGTIWFTRANNANGTLRAITPEQDILPTTVGPFPPQ
jgi:hypothetical protein